MTISDIPPPPSRPIWQRVPLLASALVALIAGLWAGLLRLGWALPPISARLLAEHGPLMVSGFLGTLISLERSVAISQVHKQNRLYYLPPFFAGMGALSLFLPLPQVIPRIMLVLGALGLLAIFIVIYRLHPATHYAVMGTGALLWLLGNSLWLAGLPVFRVVPWWAGFLILTIAGERLELARVLIRDRTPRVLFVIFIAVVLLGLLVSTVAFDPGVRVAGLGLAALGTWLFRYDIARRTIRQRGLTQYIAACLLPGYFWLLLGGLLWLVYGGAYQAGPVYDAMLHTIFLGFVFSMIFGHAPVIIPAIIGTPLRFSPAFYLHLGLLHLSLVLRVLSNLLSWLPVRRWGGLLNELAILIFIFMTIIAVRRGRRDQPSS